MGYEQKITEQNSHENIQDQDEFYTELTSRNQHFVRPNTQKSLRELTILVAGCGSTGGAVIESLARLGVENFILADNGEYELNNLNRQHATVRAIGTNKAEFHRQEVLGINPFAKVRIFSAGVTRDNCAEMVHPADIIFDAVDVTTPTGMEMKIHLHEVAYKARKPVLSGLDLGFCQWGVSMDYRVNSAHLLFGRADAARRAKNPIKALFTIFPLKAVPAHGLDLVEDLLTGKASFASQMGCTSDLLEALIVPIVIRFVETGDLFKNWEIDLYRVAKRPEERFRTWLRGLAKRRKVRRLLAQAA